VEYISDFIAGNIYYIDMSFKLLLSAAVGGLVGFQRESSNRPAGLRTHILVCVGSALVMITSEYVFNKYRGTTNLDPARLGAQVISGIGFLGAGTILRDGSTIKGLTTAAGLWAVACIGIAIGTGFYFGGIAAALLVYFTLLISKDWEVAFDNKNSSRKIRIYAENRPGLIGDVEEKFQQNQIIIKSIKILPSKNSSSVKVLLYVKYPGTTAREKVISSLCNTQGVIKVD
jgi:putative Mg2+ transporter-C (MgtC) family protein